MRGYGGRGGAKSFLEINGNHLSVALPLRDAAVAARRSRAEKADGGRPCAFFTEPRISLGKVSARYVLVRVKSPGAELTLAPVTPVAFLASARVARARARATRRANVDI